MVNLCGKSRCSVQGGGAGGLASEQQGDSADAVMWLDRALVVSGLPPAVTADSSSLDVDQPPPPTAAMVPVPPPLHKVFSCNFCMRKFIILQAHAANVCVALRVNLASLAIHKPVLRDATALRLREGIVGRPWPQLIYQEVLESALTSWPGIFRMRTHSEPSTSEKQTPFAPD
jgi:hypothetical protein